MQQFTHIIGVGNHPATPASELQVGDVLVWNYNYRSTIVSIQPRGNSQLTIVERYHHNDSVYQRNVTKTRLIATTKGQNQ